MKRLSCGVALALLAGASAGRAGSMSGDTHALRPTAVNSGGREDHSSASHRLIGGVAESGQSTAASAGHALQPGLAGLLAWPDTVLTLSASTGAAEGSIDLRWVAPRADGSTGTAAAYSLRLASGAEPSPASNEAQFWLSLSATHYVSLAAPSPPGTTEQLTVTGLANGVTYYFAVKARSDGDSWGFLSRGATAWAQTDSLPPNAVSLNAATGAGTGELDLSWVVTGDNGGVGDILGGQYEITYSSHGDFSSGVYVIADSTSIAAGSDAGRTLTGLEGGTLYYVKVRLADEAGNWSGESNTRSAVAKAETIAPGAVTLSAAAGDAEGKIRLSWNVTGDDGGTGDIVDGQYEITYSSYSDFTNTIHVVANSTSVSAGAAVGYVLTGLEAGTVYYAKVRLADEVPNWSVESNVANVAAQGDVTPPNAVGLVAFGVGAGAIDLLWTVTGDDGVSGGISGGQYEIKYSSYSDFTNTVYTVTNSTTVAAGSVVGYSLTGLEAGTVYYAKVRLADEAPNWSGESNTADAAAQGDVTAPSAVTLGAVTGAAHGELDVSWTVTGDDAGSGNITNGRYEITYSSYSDFTNTVYTLDNSTTIAAGSAVGYTLTGLEAGTVYYAKVRLADEVPNWSGDSNTANAVSQSDSTAPDAVTLNAATGATEGKLNLTWSVTGDDASTGDIVNGWYEITYSSYSDFTNTIHTITNSTTVAAGAAVGYTLTGLEAGTVYYAKVRLADGVPNWSGASNTANAAVQGDVTPPGAVGLSAATGAVEGEIDLDWTVTGDDAGLGDIVAGQYEIKYSSYADFTSGVVYTVTQPTSVPAGSAVGHTLTGLEAGKIYYIRVRLADEAPNWSGNSNTPNASAQSDVSAPDAVVLSALPGAAGKINLAWAVTGDDASSGDIVSGQYEIKYSSYSDFTNTVHTITNSTTVAAGANVGHILTGLEADKTYYAKVRLADEAPNWSTTSNTAQATVIDTAAPDGIYDLVADPGAQEGEIRLTWSATGDNGAAGDIANGKYRIDYYFPADDPGYIFDVNTFKVEFATNTSPGDPQSYTLTNLLPEVLYHIKIFLGDEVPNWNPASNLASALPQGPAGPLESCGGCDIFARTPTLGGRSALSAGHRLSNTVAELGQSTSTSASYVLQPGLANLAAWPQTVLDLTASSGTSEGSVVLKWTAPKADGSTGTAAAYEIRYSTVEADAPDLSEASFGLAKSATDFISLPAPSPPGTTEQLTINGLEGGTTYYFAVKAKAVWHGWGYRSHGAARRAPARSVDIFEAAYDFGSLAVDVSTVVVTSLTVTNNGDVAATFAIRTTTMTTLSPWTPSVSGANALDTYVLQGLFHPAQPSHAQFQAEDVVQEASQASQTLGGGGRYTVDDSETGVSVPAGQSRALWLRFTTPLESSTTNAQLIKVRVSAQ